MFKIPTQKIMNVKKFDSPFQDSFQQNKPDNSNHFNDFIKTDSTMNNYKNEEKVNIFDDSNFYLKNQLTTPKKIESKKRSLFSDNNFVSNNDDYLKNLNHLNKEKPLKIYEDKKNENLLKEFQDIISQTNSINSPQKPTNEFYNHSTTSIDNEDKMKSDFNIFGNVVEKNDINNNKKKDFYGHENISFSDPSTISNRDNNFISSNADSKFKNNVNNKEESSDEEILNDLLGISKDFKRNDKKDTKMKKNQPSLFSDPFLNKGEESSFDSTIKLNQNNNNNQKDVKKKMNFFDILEKESKEINKNKEKESIENGNYKSFIFPGKQINQNLKNGENNNKKDKKINEIFEYVVKEEEKAQEKKMEDLKNKEGKNKEYPLSPLDINLETNLNQTSQKLDKEFKRIPISLAQIDMEKEENSNKKKNKKVFLK